jgi:hypothetical protein
MRRFEQLLIALGPAPARAGTPSFRQLVHQLRDGLPQSKEPQTLIVGARPLGTYLRTRYPLLQSFRKQPKS